MIETSFGPAKVLQFESLLAEPGLLHAVSTRIGGVSTGQFHSLNVSISGGDDPASVDENRRRVLAGLGLDPLDLATMGQVHGARTEIVEPRIRPVQRPFFPETDAMITDLPRTPLMALCADCAPILLWDPVNRAIGAVHAGWRGALGGVVLSAIEGLHGRFESNPEDLRAGIGPCIGPCCYEVRDQVLEPLAETVPDPERFIRRDPAGRTFFDLPGFIAADLESIGVEPNRIERSGICTACNPQLLYSHRAEKGRTGRFGAFIAVSS